jgi:DNA-binding transcriptional LysR family regulator
VLVAAAVAGEGVTYQPTFLVRREIGEGLLVRLALDHEPVELDGIFAVYPSDRRPAAKVRTFIDFLADRFASMVP